MLRRIPEAAEIQEAFQTLLRVRFLHWLAQFQLMRKLIVRRYRSCVGDLMFTAQQVLKRFSYWRSSAGLLVAPQFVLDQISDKRIVALKPDVGHAGIFQLVEKVNVENVSWRSFRVWIKLCNHVCIGMIPRSLEGFELRHNSGRQGVVTSEIEHEGPFS